MDTPADAPASPADPPAAVAPSRSRLLVVASLLSLGLFFGGVRIAASLLASPNPQEYREPAALLSTGLLLQGKNPYALEFQPVFTNLYGILYHLVVYPLAKLAGDTYTVHRAVATAFVLAAAASLAWGLRVAGVRWHLVWIGAVLFLTDLATRYAPLNLMA